MVPVVWPLEGFIHGNSGIYTGPSEEINGVLNLWGTFVPKLNREVGVGSPKGSDKAIFERLDCLFGSVDAMIVRLDELEDDFLRHKVSLYEFCGLMTFNFGVNPFETKYSNLFLYVARMSAESSPEIGVTRMAFVS